MRRWIGRCCLLLLAAACALLAWPRIRASEPTPSGSHRCSRSADATTARGGTMAIAIAARNSLRFIMTNLDGRQSIPLRRNVFPIAETRSRSTYAEIEIRREQVLRLRFARLSEPEIAERLRVSASTVSRDLQVIHESWGERFRAEFDHCARSMRPSPCTRCSKRRRSESWYGSKRKRTAAQPQR